MSAFDDELKVLRAEAEMVDAHVINGRRYYIGGLRGRDVVMVLSGKSMVNAAMTTQTLLDHFNIESIECDPGQGRRDVLVPSGQHDAESGRRSSQEGAAQEMYAIRGLPGSRSESRCGGKRGEWSLIRGQR
jgi:hypothetical protein